METTSCSGRRRRCHRRLLALTVAALAGASLAIEPAPALAIWVSQGPAPNLVPGFAGYTEVSGAVEVIAPHPTDPNRVYVGATNGGIWRTDDAMATRPSWVPLTDDEVSLSITALAFDPLDPSHDTLYAGFGASSRGLTHAGLTHGPLPGMLLKTVDGGAAWSRLVASVFTNQRIQEILPTTLGSGSKQVILVATANHFQAGVYRSADSGKHWKRVLDGSIYDLAADPSVPTRFFASRFEGVSRSDDGGLTWTVLPASPGGPATHLAISPTTDELGRHWLFAAVRGAGVHYSNDSADSWTAMDAPFPDGSHAVGTVDGVTQIAVSPSNPRQVFVAGDGASWWRGNAAAAPGIQWFSLSGANTGGTNPHTDSRCWAFGADPNVLFESDDGGIYRLHNAVSGTPVWQSAIGSLAVTEFLTIAYDSVHNTVFGSSWDNSIPRQTTPGDPVWTVNERFFADGIQVGVDNGTPGISVHYSSQQLLFGAQRQVVSSGGTTTTDLGLDIHVGGGTYVHYNMLEGNIYVDNDNDLGTVRFNQNFVVNDVDGTRMVIGTDYLYESFDRGDHFTSLGGIGMNVEGDPIPLNPVGTVSAYAYGHSQDPDMLVVGTFGNASGENLWLRRNGTGYPSPLATYPGGVPADIAMDPDDPDRLFVVTRDEQVWRSIDGGASSAGWRNLTGSNGSPSTDLHTIEVMRPASGIGPSIVAVAGYGGLFAAEDADDLAWWSVGGAFPNVIVTDVRYDSDDDVLVAGTYGRGAWTLSDATAEVSSGPCGDGPRTGCLAAASRGSGLSLTTGAKQSLSWKWKSVGTVTASTFGQPDATSPYVLCVYDSSGVGAVRFSGLLPAGPRWKASSKGYSYKSKTGLPGGIIKGKLHAGTTGKELVKGKGAGLTNPGGPLVEPVTAQLLRSDGAFCSEAVYSASTTNDGNRYKAKSD